MNHVWLFTFDSPDAQRKLLNAKELEIKGKRCLAIDPNDGEVRLKLPRLPFHISDEAVRRALEPYGKVTEVTRDTWRVDGFTGVQSTTRLVKLTLREGVTKDNLPHQLRVLGGNVLVLVPGRAPLCLRCKRMGHIRRDCRVPRCEKCNRIGHESQECARTYGAVTGVSPTDTNEHEMYEEEAEAAARSGTPDTPLSVTLTPPKDEAAREAMADGPIGCTRVKPPPKSTVRYQRD